MIYRQAIVVTSILSYEVYIYTRVVYAEACIVYVEVIVYICRGRINMGGWK